MTQEQALAILKTGAHVFLTGEAGSGKTYIINQYTDYLREHDIDFAVTASTGIAATHIHGTTIHSWSGIGVQDVSTDEGLKRIAENKYVAKRIKKAKVLIIDEISMLDGKLLSAVERVCRNVRKQGLPFGGLQVILVGDFFQLPPVPDKGVKVEFAFDSDAWNVLMPTLCYLTEQHRQEDSSFLGLLKAIRRNEVDETHFETIRERIVEMDQLPEDMTRLYSHNANVDVLNMTELKKLPGKTNLFLMACRGPEPLTEALKRGCLSPEKLELKEGAAVMFTKNNSGAGFVNGTLGTVMGFDAVKKYPKVKTTDGLIIVVEPMEWVIADGEEVIAKITQLPLRLAWALTIHKSQGVSLDSAVMDLSQTFEYGQGYVALSRVRSLSGLHLIGVNRRALEVHPVVLKKDEFFRESSERADEEFSDLPDARVEELMKNFITISGGKHRVPKRTKRKKEEKSPEGKPFEILRAKHKNAYRSWTKEEEQELTRLFNRGVQMKEMSEKMGRNPGALRSRFKKLGLVSI